MGEADPASILTDPTATASGTADPTATGSGTADPTATGSGAADPGATGSGTADPGATGSGAGSIGVAVMPSVPVPTPSTPTVIEIEDDVVKAELDEKTAAPLAVVPATAEGSLPVTPNPALAPRPATSASGSPNVLTPPSSGKTNVWDGHVRP